jgi:hypothetical protein
MSLLSSVTGAAATLAAGLDPTTTPRKPGLTSGSAGGLAGARVPDALTARLSATRSGKTTATKASTVTRKTATASKTTSSAKTSAAAKKTTSASSGYSTAASGDDFAFLKDRTLSVEEKLFRFMCAVAKRNDDEVLRKMEEMKGGAAKAAGAGSSSGSSAAKKPAATSVWSALKALVPPLGLAAQVVGDAKLKSMITQVSGPVLAAAVSALGLPALAPLAMQAGPGLASALVNGKVGGGEAVAAASGSSTGASGSSSSASSTAATGKNEQVQLMELQRLIDKQKEMFAMISNVLRAQHDTRMSIIGNVR